jgi:hypothetical protein
MMREKCAFITEKFGNNAIFSPFAPKNGDQIQIGGLFLSAEDTLLSKNSLSFASS